MEWSQARAEEAGPATAAWGQADGGRLVDGAVATRQGLVRDNDWDSAIARTKPIRIGCSSSPLLDRLILPCQMPLCGGRNTDSDEERLEPI